MTFIRLVLALHVAAASIALAALWLPLVAKKGGALHRRVGWIYVGAMGVVGATAFVVSGFRLATEADAGRRASAIFLLYVSLLATTSLVMGVRVLRHKQRTAAHRHPLDVGLPALLLCAGVALGALGLSAGRPLFYGFAPIGILVGGGQLAYWLRPPRRPMHWWLEHMGGMIGSGIAALTAFTVTNAHRFHVPGFSLWVWLAPTLLGVPGLVAWQAYYARRFQRRIVGAWDARSSASSSST